MKNTKAVLLIILGAFIMATGFAFAEQVAYKQAEDAVAKPPEVVFGNSNASLPTGTARTAAVKDPVQEKLDQIRALNIKAADPAPAPAPAPKPTIMDGVKKFIGAHKADILLAGAGAYIGWALMGTVAGALTGGLGFLLFFMFANL
ncbi:MAG: hypothetical protein M0011_05040 [Elusimicrobia bacterium]|nr:hypothetical protein [Elusimicrobiota bacterium]